MFRRLMFLSLISAVSLLSACGPGTTNVCSGVKSSGSTSGKDVGVRETTLDTEGLAQSFQAPKTVGLASVAVELAVTGAFSTTGYTLTLAVENNVSGAPGGLVSTDATAFIDAVYVSSGYRRFTFPKSVNLTEGTVYWVTLKADYPQSDKLNIRWLAHDGADGGYSGGKALYQDRLIGWTDLAIGSLRDFQMNLDCPVENPQ